MVHPTLGLRPAAGKGRPTPDSQDRMDPTITLEKKGKESIYPRIMNDLAI